MRTRKREDVRAVTAQLAEDLAGALAVHSLSLHHEFVAQRMRVFVRVSFPVVRPAALAVRNIEPCPTC